MSKLDQLLQLRDLKKQRHQVALLRGAEAKQKEQEAIELRGHRCKQHATITMAHNDFLADVLQGSDAIADPASRLTAVSWKLRTRQVEIGKASKALFRADRELATATHDVAKAEASVKAKKVGLDQLDDLVVTEQSKERRGQDLREEDRLAEQAIMTDLAKSQRAAR